ncbi:hypothetical protein [Flavobacterium rhizosphaerae]|uniref:Uncharacterized protein n=1 Tax=Flavobacterium rhizosphaerae TaxID=3163298 RepID=A0ABW8Z0N4_9FLAO
MVSWLSKKRRFDFKPVVISAIIFGSYYVLENAEDGILFSKPVIYAQIGDMDITSGHINLYGNNQFYAVKRYIEWKDAFKGTYQLDNDTLILKRDDLTKVTKGLFTNCYIFNKTRDSLLPCQSGFNKLAIISKTQKQLRP